MDAERRALLLSQKAFDENFDKLVEFLPDSYIAFIDRRLVAFHDDLGVLVEKVYSSFDQRPIFMTKIEAPREIKLPQYS